MACLQPGRSSETVPVVVANLQGTVSSKLKCDHATLLGVDKFISDASHNEASRERADAPAGHGRWCGAGSGLHRNAPMALRQ